MVWHKLEYSASSTAQHVAHVLATRPDRKSTRVELREPGTDEDSKSKREPHLDAADGEQRGRARGGAHDAHRRARLHLAWGLIDGIFSLMGCLAERARALTTLLAVRTSADPAETHRLIAAALPALVAAVTPSAELDVMQRRLQQLPAPSVPARLRRDDWLGAACTQRTPRAPVRGGRRPVTVIRS
jgi:hypothetical protein